MLKNALILTFYYLFVATSAAQPASLQDSESGTNVYDVQLSITLTNKVLIASHVSELHADITNSATNTITLVETGRSSDFDTLLRSAIGKEFHLTPSANAADSFREVIRIAPGQSRRWVIPFLVTKDIGPGPYILEATRMFRLNGRWLKSVSNQLKVQVVN